MASLDIVDRVHPDGLPPAHIGVNAGPMIYDEGDYFGRTVNIAARIASQAGPDQVFVGEDVLRHITPSGFRLVEVGAFELKGIANPVVLHEAFPDGNGWLPRPFGWVLIGERRDRPRSHRLVGG